MWLCLPDAFFSIVQHPKKPALLVVRARTKSHLARYFPRRKIYTWPGCDYRHRVFAPRGLVVDVVRTHLLSALTYGNFKNEVSDPTLHGAYHNVWRELLVLDDARLAGRVGGAEQLPLDVDDWPLEASDRLAARWGGRRAYGAARGRTAR